MSKKLKYKPLGDRVIVEPVSAEQVTKSGIVLPESAQEKPQRGTVLAVGTGRTTEDGKNIPLNLKEGDIVIYSRYGGNELKLDGSEYVILREADVLAVESK